MEAASEVKVRGSLEAELALEQQVANDVAALNARVEFTQNSNNSEWLPYNANDAAQRTQELMCAVLNDGLVRRGTTEQQNAASEELPSVFRQHKKREDTVAKEVQAELDLLRSNPQKDSNSELASGNADAAPRHAAATLRLLVERANTAAELALQSGAAAPKHASTGGRVDADGPERMVRAPQEGLNAWRPSARERAGAHEQLPTADLDAVPQSAVPPRAPVTRMAEVETGDSRERVAQRDDVWGRLMRSTPAVQEGSHEQEVLLGSSGVRGVPQHTREGVTERLR